MANSPDQPPRPDSKPPRLAGEGKAGGKRDPAKHSKKDPAKPTRAKANRPDFPPTDPELERLLNPGIHGGTAGPGPSTGIRPPADNSKDRRADFSAAHTARASTQGFGEAPQPPYGGGEKIPLAGIDRSQFLLVLGREAALPARPEELADTEASKKGRRGRR